MDLVKKIEMLEEQNEAWERMYNKDTAELIEENHELKRKIEALSRLVNGSNNDNKGKMMRHV